MAVTQVHKLQISQITQDLKSYVLVSSNICAAWQKKPSDLNSSNRIRICQKMSLKLKGLSFKSFKWLSILTMYNATVNSDVQMHNLTEFSTLCGPHREFTQRE